MEQGTFKDKSVQEFHSKGESIDGTCVKTEDNQEDLSLFELMDKIEEYDILTSTFHFGRVETTPEETEARDQEDPSTGHLGVLMDSIRNGMKVLIDYTNNEMKALKRDTSIWC